MIIVYNENTIVYDFSNVENFAESKIFRRLKTHSPLIGGLASVNSRK